MLELTKLLRFIIVLGFLLYACKLDLKSRIVPNKVWKYMLLTSLPLTILELLLAKYSVGVFIIAAVQLAIVFALAYILYIIGAFGGADAKALMCLAVIFPTYPSYNGFPLFTGFSFSFAVLANSALAAPFLLIAMFLRNLAREGIGNMRGNVFYYFVGYRVRVSKIPKFHNLLEYINEKGEFVRAKKAVEPNDRLIAALKKRNIEYVWVTPALPFIVFMTAGYIVAFFIGDLLLLLLSALV